MAHMQRHCVNCREEGKPVCYGYVKFDEFGHKTIDCSEHACSHKHDPKNCLFSGRDITHGLCPKCFRQAMFALDERRRKR